MEIIVDKATDKCVTNFTPISDRIILLQVRTKPVPLNVIKIYARTADRLDEEVEQFYQQKTQVLKAIPNSDLTVIMRDFKAKIGRGRSRFR